MNYLKEITGKKDTSEFDVESFPLVQKKKYFGTLEKTRQMCRLFISQGGAFWGAHWWCIFRCPVTERRAASRYIRSASESIVRIGVSTYASICDACKKIAVFLKRPITRHVIRACHRRYKITVGGAGIGVIEHIVFTQ